nr:ABC transporter permease subunit [uncultured Blautia sp.]
MSERLAGILVSSFTRILIPGIKVTIPLTLLSFVFGCIIALFLALVQIANVKGLKQFARFYIWVFRGTPLIVQLFIIFFGLPSVGIILDAFPSAVIAFALYCEAAVIYLMICTVLTWIQNYFEKKLVWNTPAPVKGE